MWYSTNPLETIHILHTPHQWHCRGFFPIKWWEVGSPFKIRDNFCQSVYGCILQKTSLHSSSDLVFRWPVVFCLGVITTLLELLWDIETDHTGICLHSPTCIFEPRWFDILLQLHSTAVYCYHKRFSPSWTWVLLNHSWLPGFFRVIHKQMRICHSSLLQICWRGPGWPGPKPRPRYALGERHLGKHFLQQTI